MACNRVDLKKDRLRPRMVEAISFVRLGDGTVKPYYFTHFHSSVVRVLRSTLEEHTDGSYCLPTKNGKRKIDTVHELNIGDLDELSQPIRKLPASNILLARVEWSAAWQLGVSFMQNDDETSWDYVFLSFVHGYNTKSLDADSLELTREYQSDVTYLNHHDDHYDEFEEDPFYDAY
jgi:hypothetical protein